MDIVLEWYEDEGNENPLLAGVYGTIAKTIGLPEMADPPEKISVCLSGLCGKCYYCWEDLYLRHFYSTYTIDMDGPNDGDDANAVVAWVFHHAKRLKEAADKLQANAFRLLVQMTQHPSDPPGVFHVAFHCTLQTGPDYIFEEEDYEGG